MIASALLLCLLAQVGEVPPDFTLPDRQGRKVTLSQFRGHKRVVLVFYRGQW